MIKLSLKKNLKIPVTTEIHLTLMIRNTFEILLSGKNAKIF